MNDEDAPPDLVTELQLLLSPSQQGSRPRATGPSYTGTHAYHVVLSTDRRQPFFVDATLVGGSIRRLQEAGALLGFKIVAYCFMPDYVHFVPLGITAGASLSGLLQRFKQLTSFNFKTQTGQALWQRRDFVRTLRADEDLESVAERVWANPVKKGLVMQAADYPFSGGESPTGVSRS